MVRNRRFDLSPQVRDGVGGRERKGRVAVGHIIAKSIGSVPKHSQFRPVVLGHLGQEKHLAFVLENRVGNAKVPPGYFPQVPAATVVLK